MATAGKSFQLYDQATPLESNDLTSSTEPHRHNNHSSHPRPGQHLDDADLLAWKRQYANIGLREKNTISNSADDLSQLDDRLQYQFEVFSQDYNDMEDDEIHFDNGNNYDYEADIQERLKKVNEEFEHDQTPVELKHRQRVSFDAIVKAVDIVQDPQEHANGDSVVKPSVSPVVEEPSVTETSPQNDANPVEYTVPLNDTQPKEGPTLLQQLKAMQFHGVPLAGDRWSTIASNNKTNGSPTREDSPSLKSDSNNKTDNQQMTTEASSSSKKSMLVSINGGFELQNEDDYMAKDSTEKRQNKNNDDDDDDDEDDDDKKTSKPFSTVRYYPKPPTEAKTSTDSSKPPPPPTRLSPSITRPKSSDSGKRTTNSANTLSKSFSDSRAQSAKDREQRPKSAVVSKSLERTVHNPSSGINFEELCRQAAEKKREELREERRKKKEEEEKRKETLTKAKERFEQWVRDKDAERKRLNEEKRIENEEREARRIKHEKELEELREKKFKEWSERKKRDVLIAAEFRKLQAEEELTAETGGSSSALVNPSKRADHRAFNRWLRRKYEQSKEEKRRLRLEARRLRRVQRRSIKRFQLQQDLQLAKSFGYS